MRSQMRDAAAGERSWPGSASDTSERSGREMARPRTMLIICLIMVANSHVDQERGFPGKEPRDNQETPDQKLDHQNPEGGSGLSFEDYASQMTDDTLPNMAKRQSAAPKKKIHRALGWAIGTMLTFVTIVLLIGALSLTSRGTQTTEDEQTRGRCCTLLGWLTRTSSQLPLWKSLTLKLVITVISTLGAGAFSLLLTNLLAEREESVEQTVRDILGLTEDDSSDRRRRDAEPDPGKIHWLWCLFIIWLTTIPLICYIIVAKFNDEGWTGRECLSPDTEMGDNQFIQNRRRQERREAREQKRNRTRARQTSDSSTSSWPTPPSVYRTSTETPPPPFYSAPTWNPTTPPPPPPMPTTPTTGMSLPASDRTPAAVGWFARLQKGLRHGTRDVVVEHQLEVIREEQPKLEPMANTSG